MAVREKTEKEIKNPKKNRKATEKFAVYPLNLFGEKQLFFTKKQYNFSIKYIDRPINNFNRSRESPMPRWDKFTYREFLLKRK